jgi:rhodanese-related sulfurtransferase
MKSSIINFFLVSLLVFPILGCLDDRISPELKLQTESAIELLVYLESHGDYINSSEINDFVSAFEVYANRSSYLIIDVRSQTDFAFGHIENAKNVLPNNLFKYIKNATVNNFVKIVIISESGQSAAYYTALLRLGGFNNIYSMEYGMAVWHQDFSSIWLSAIRDFRTAPGEHNYFTNEDYPKPGLTSLPKLNFQNNNKSVKEKLDERIIKLFDVGFDEKLVDTSVSPKHGQSLFDEGASIVVGTIYSSYNIQTNSFPNYYVVCFGSNYLYKAHSMEGPFAGQGHLPSAVKYLPEIDIRSTNDLQTIPTNNIVVVYDVNGQVSPKLTAYLRVLGYDAKSMLFGANSLFYSRVLWVESLAPFAFKPEMIMNLPYVTGN